MNSMPIWMMSLDHELTVTRESDSDRRQRIARLLQMTLEALEWLTRHHGAP